MSDYETRLRRENRQVREQNERLRQELEATHARVKALEAARDVAVRLLVSGAPERRSTGN